MYNEFFKKNQTVLLFSASFLAVLFLTYSISFLRRIAAFNQLKHNIPVGEIYGQKTIGQTLRAEYDDLSGIELLLATYSRKNSGELNFHLKKDVDSQEELFICKRDISKVKDNRYYMFEFPPINNSKGKKFYFYLEAPQSQPGNAITIWSNSSDSYKEGEKIINGIVSDGDLAFKTIYHPGIKGGIDTLLAKTIQNKPFPLNKKIFYIILILLFILNSSLFLTFIIKSIQKRG